MNINELNWAVHWSVSFLFFFRFDLDTEVSPGRHPEVGKRARNVQFSDSGQVASDVSCCDDCARELQKPWLEKAHVTTKSWQNGTNGEKLRQQIAGGCSVNCSFECLLNSTDLCLFARGQSCGCGISEGRVTWHGHSAWPEFEGQCEPWCFVMFQIVVRFQNSTLTQPWARIHGLFRWCRATAPEQICGCGTAEDPEEKALRECSAQLGEPHGTALHFLPHLRFWAEHGVIWLWYDGYDVISGSDGSNAMPKQTFQLASAGGTRPEWDGWDGQGAPLHPVTKNNEELMLHGSPWSCDRLCRMRECWRNPSFFSGNFGYLWIG